MKKFKTVSELNTWMWDNFTPSLKSPIAPDEHEMAEKLAALGYNLDDLVEEKYNYTLDGHTNGGWRYDDEKGHAPDSPSRDSVRGKRMWAHLSRAEMARRFDIPVRTIENWEAGISKPAPWAEKLIIEKLDEIAKEIRKMEKYEVKRNTVEIRYADRKDVKMFCTLDQRDQEPEVLAWFPDIDDASNEYRKYRSSVEKVGNYFRVTEYYIELNEYDADNEFIQCVGVVAISPLSIRIVNESYDTIAEFDNMADAEKFYNDYDGEGEISIVFD